MNHGEISNSINDVDTTTYNVIIIDRVIDCVSITIVMIFLTSLAKYWLKYINQILLMQTLLGQSWGSNKLSQISYTHTSNSLRVDYTNIFELCMAKLVLKNEHKMACVTMRLENV